MKFYTVKEVAKFFRISERTLRNKAAKGQIPNSRIVDENLRFSDANIALMVRQAGPRETRNQGTQ